MFSPCCSIYSGLMRHASQFCALKHLWASAAGEVICSLSIMLPVCRVFGAMSYVFQFLCGPSDGPGQAPPPRPPPNLHLSDHEQRSWRSSSRTAAFARRRAHTRSRSPDRQASTAPASPRTTYVAEEHLRLRSNNGQILNLGDIEFSSVQDLHAGSDRGPGRTP